MSRELYDLHSHTTFSDGSEMAAMVAAAEKTPCDGVGLSDHCILIEDDFGRRSQYDLVDTYERRRERIEDLRHTFDIEIFDAVEMSYVPGIDAETRSFLEEADFDYSIGAVHFAGEHEYTSGAQYVDADDDTIQEAVDAYYQTLTELIDSELFDVVAHLDLPERHAVFRDRTTDAHYRMIADALVDSRTVPEINAGRSFRSLGRVHPNPDVLDVFTDRGIEFVLGSDSHKPDEITRRVPHLREFVRERGLSVRPLDTLVSEMGSETRSA